MSTLYSHSVVQWTTLLKFNDLANLHADLKSENNDTRSAHERLTEENLQNREGKNQKRLCAVFEFENKTQTKPNIADELDTERTTSVDDLAKDFKFKHNIPGNEIERLKRINDAMDVVLKRKTVPPKELKLCLTKVEWLQFEEYCQQPCETDGLRLAGERPDELASYIEKLNKADLVWYQFENRRNLTKPRELEYRAETLYESAAERLAEICASADANERARIMMWLDRTVSFDDPNKMDNITLGPHSMPRVIGTKSKYALKNSALPKASARIQKQLATIEILLEAAVEIGFNLPQVESDNDAALSKYNPDRLQKMLGHLKKYG